LLTAAAAPAAGVLWAVSPERAAWAFFLPVLALLLFLYDFLRAPSARRLRASLTPPQSLTCGTPSPFPVRLSIEGLQEPLAVLVFLSAKGPLKVSRGRGAKGGLGPKGGGGRGASEKALKGGALEAGGAGAERDGDGGPAPAAAPFAPFPGASWTTLTGGRGLIMFVLRPLRRGWAYIDTLWTAWRGPLGFCEVRRKIWIGHNFTISQDARGAVGESLRALSEEFSSGQKSQPFLGEGSEFENLADFSFGNDSRCIDWKHSATHRRLLVKEFRQERNQHIILGFDTGRLMTAPSDHGTRLDSFVRAGLALGWASLRAGDFVGGCAFDLLFKGWLPPGRTPSFFTRLQKFTAGLGYSALETNFTLSLTALAQRLRQRSLVVLFTEFSDSAAATLLLECLELLARRHTVIFVTTPDQEIRGLPYKRPDSFPAMAEALIADRLIRERAVVLERMSRLGVHTLDVKESLLAPELIRRFLSIKRRGSL
jgi:uncharacterized protein (DUF58 family)